jgi:hypothetical protein
MANTTIGMIIDEETKETMSRERASRNLPKGGQ